MPTPKSAKPVARLQNVYCKTYGADGQVELWKQNDFARNSSEIQVTSEVTNENLEDPKSQDTISNDRVSETDNSSNSEKAPKCANIQDSPIYFNDLEDNLVLVSNEKDFLTHDIERLEQKQEVAEAENSSLFDSLVIAENEKDLLEEENDNLIGQRNLLADNYDNLLEQNQNIEEDHAVLLEVNHQRQIQVQNEIGILWADLERPVEECNGCSPQ